MKQSLSILAGKIARKTSRITGRGGSNIPGVVARKIDPSILKQLAKGVEKIILVSGTNGKTTTAQLLAHILKASGEKVVYNEEGANLITGITASFVEASSIRKGVTCRYAVIESDEATIAQVAKELTPSLVVFTNFFRDQLDRYGEIDLLLESISNALSSHGCPFLLNADDPFTCRLGTGREHVVHYGMHREAFAFDQHEMTESKYCPSCGSEMKYEHIHYSQLGYFSCQCGFNRPNPAYELTGLTGEGGLRFSVNNEAYHVPMGGMFNAGNALAAIAAAQELGLGHEVIRQALTSYRSENGRMQVFSFGEHTHRLNLVKNPAGANLTLSEVLYASTPQQVVLFLNDLAYDGRDISWIWDADYERLCDSSVERVICSGMRAYDLALRLKYAGFPEERIVVVEDKEKAIDQAIARGMDTFYIPNYTALEPVRKYLDRESKRNYSQQGGHA